MTTEKQLSLREWIKAYDEGQFDDVSCETQIKAGWYDWFCSDRSLKGRLKRLAPKVKRLAGSNLIDQDKVYVFFKNNCPLKGSLYDDFRICDLETGNVRFTIVPSSGHNVCKGRSEVWGLLDGEKEFKAHVVGSWNDVLTFFGV